MVRKVESNPVSSEDKPSFPKKELLKPDITELFYTHVGLKEESASGLQKKSITKKTPSVDEKEIFHKELLSGTTTPAEEANAVCETTLPDLISDILRATRISIGTFRSPEKHVGITTNLLGLGSLFSLITGGMLYARGATAYAEELQKPFQDETALHVGQMAMIRGVLQALGGLCVTISRLSLVFIHSMEMDPSQITKGGKFTVPGCSFLLSTTGNTLFSCVFFFTMISTAPQLLSSFSLSNRLGLGLFSSEPREKVVERLQKELEIDPEKIRKELDEKLLSKEVDRVATRFLEKLSIFTNKNKKTSKTEQMIEAFLKDTTWNNLPHFSGIYTSLNTMEDLTPKQRLGLYLTCENKRSFQENFIEQHLGKTILEKLKDPTSTIEVQEMQSALWTQRLIHVGVFLIGAIGLCLSITDVTAKIHLFALPVMVSVVLASLLSTISFALDATGLIEALQQTGPVKLGEWIINYGNVALSILVLVGIVALSGASMGTAPVAIAVLAAVFWVASSVASVAVLHFQSRQYNEENISIEKAKQKLASLKARTHSIGVSKEYLATLKKINKAIEKSCLSKKTKEQLQEKLDIPLGESYTAGVKRPKIEYFTIFQEEITRLQEVIEEVESKNAQIKDSLSAALEDLANAIPSSSEHPPSFEKELAKNWLTDLSSWLQESSLYWIKPNTT